MVSSTNLDVESYKAKTELEPNYLEVMQNIVLTSITDNFENEKTEIC